MSFALLLHQNQRTYNGNRQAKKSDKCKLKTYPDSKKTPLEHEKRVDDESEELSQPEVSSQLPYNLTNIVEQCLKCSSWLVRTRQGVSYFLQHINKGHGPQLVRSKSSGSATLIALS